jgi:DNA-binding winged helix-turn-helix (wHTH) protein/tetratricopeptide (TPR) repeat protein
VTDVDFSFGDRRLCLARRELWHGDTQVELPARVFDCIAYLIRHRDRAVGRDELMAAVWGRTVVVDNLLDQVVLRARRALGDLEGDRHVIRTVRRFGYAWVAPVECLAPLDPPATGIAPEPEPVAQAHAQAPDEGPAPPGSAPTAAASARGRRWVPVATAGILLAAIAVGGMAWRQPASQAPAAPPLPTQGWMALVLPFHVEAGSDLAWVRLGAMDLVASHLRDAGLAVVPSDNVVALARGHADAAWQGTDVAALAHAARASLVVAGDAAPEGHRWKVSLHTLTGIDPPVAVHGEAADVLDAARLAADRMSALLGYVPSTMAGSSQGLAIEALLHRSEAAILSDRLDVARALLDRAPKEQRTLPEIRYQHGLIDFYSGRFDDAGRQYRSLIRDVSAADDPLLRAKALSGLGMVQMRLSDYQQADQQMSAAAALLESNPGRTANHQLGRLLSSRGALRAILHHADAARADFSEARVLLENSGDQLALTGLDSNVGLSNEVRNHFAEALPYFERAVADIASFHSPNNELRLRENLAQTQLFLLDPRAAYAQDERLQALIGEIADTQLAEYARVVRVRILRAVGRDRQAEALLEELLRLPERKGDYVRRAWSASLAAERDLATGHWKRAEDEAQESLAIAWRFDFPEPYARTWLTLVRAQLAAGARDRAAASVKSLAAWGKTGGGPDASLYAALAAAELAADTGDDTAATKAFETALGAADAMRVPLDVLQVCAAYGSYLVRKGQASRAAPVAERLSAWVDRDYDAALVQLRVYRALREPAAWKTAFDRVSALAGERVIAPDLASGSPARGAGGSTLPNGRGERRVVH